MGCLKLIVSLPLFSLWFALYGCGIEVGNPNQKPTPQKMFHIPKLSLHLEDKFKGNLSEEEKLDLAVILKYEHFSQHTNYYQSEESPTLANCDEVRTADTYIDAECYEVAIGKDGDVVLEVPGETSPDTGGASEPRATPGVESSTEVIVKDGSESTESSEPSGNSYDEYWKGNESIGECIPGTTQTPCQYSAEETQMVCEKVETASTIEMVCYDQKAPETWSPNVIEFQSAYILKNDDSWGPTTEKSLDVMTNYEPDELETGEFTALAATFSKILRFFDNDQDDKLTLSETDLAIEFIIDTLNMEASQ